ncbi:hypothetical protein D9615_003712 [Tricholomella constricta]|uniref:DUF676 domain-containing protein n=1 Tax=Tricholomella constricta TaxID=117010 RepID=A0A8H5M7N6_9AGAR|nr:hypothetical protein D9615_003712 [Tricholomella constricta]
MPLSSSSMASVHLLVLIHGMWGHPGHLSELKRIISEAYSSSSDGPQLEVLMAETNRENSTYDGIDWGGERVAQEVIEKVDEIEKDGKTVLKFSVTGYSLGGLIARYVIGILRQKGFFNKIAPVNFNTIATPHIGLPRYPSFISTFTSSLGAKLLSRTGEQFYLVDKWSATGRPLIEVMADPDEDRIFQQALRQFEQIRIYANAIHDMTVPYVTSAIEIEDPFALCSWHSSSSHAEANHVIAGMVSHPQTHAATSTTCPSVALSAEYCTPFIPPNARRQLISHWEVLYSLLPVIIPVTVSLAVVHFSLAARSSRARIRLLEEDESRGQKLINILADLEDEVEHAVVDLIIDNPADSQPTSSSSFQITEGKSSPQPVQNEAIILNEVDMVEEGATTPDTSSTVRTPSASSALITDKKRKQHPREQPILSPLQHKIAGWLNQLPLRKELAYFPDVRNAHALIVCRDVKRFEAHRRGEGIIRHWAASFIL